MGADQDLGQIVRFSTIVESTASRIPLFPIQALIEQRFHEPDHVRLDLVVGASLQELRDPAGPEAVVIEEVVAQHLEGALRLFVFKKRAQAGRHIFDARTEVPYKIIKVVGVLIPSTHSEGECLHRDEGSGSADPDLAGRLLAENGLTGNQYPRLRECGDFPTCVGVNRNSVYDFFFDLRFPHVRGVKPGSFIAWKYISPPAWGKKSRLFCKIPPDLPLKKGGVKREN